MKCVQWMKSEIEEVRGIVAVLSEAKLPKKKLKFSVAGALDSEARKLRDEADQIARRSAADAPYLDSITAAQRLAENQSAARVKTDEARRLHHLAVKLRRVGLPPGTLSPAEEQARYQMLRRAF